MKLGKIDHALLVKMIQYGGINLANNKEEINHLNVFPVPDGDTGTNMNLSMQSGVSAVEKLGSSKIPEILNTYVKGLLMGARGNSGVILSQLFKGFADALVSVDEITIKDWAQALNSGVERAYKAVTNPVEGTILTVAKDTADKITILSQTEDDFQKILQVMVEEALTSLERTPDLLPVLKEVGVVDSGGMGLLKIYQGFLKAVNGQSIEPLFINNNVMEDAAQSTHDKAVQSFMDSEDIVYGYCTEFFVEFTEDKLKKHAFVEDDFRQTLSNYGDSLLVASTDEFVKVHVHTEAPGEVLSIALKYGDLAKIDIENMRKQHEAIVTEPDDAEIIEKEAAVLTIALGEGISKLFKSMGATTVIEGGQTMNPSTEDILQAIDQTKAKDVYILPNNKNILLAANQAKEITDRNLVIIPSKTIPQGVSALFEFDEEASENDNTKNMTEALSEVKTGQITFATRDTNINGIEIKKGSYIGLNDETILVTDQDKTTVVKKLIDQLITDDDEVITVFFGEDIQTNDIDALKAHLEKFDIESEYHQGDQPLYPFILMVE